MFIAVFRGSASADRSTGGKKFSRNLAPLDADGNAMGMWGVSDTYASDLREELALTLLSLLGPSRRQERLL